MTEDNFTEELETLDESNSLEEPLNLAEVEEKLRVRCKAAAIEIKENPNNRQGYLSIAIPNGREKRWIDFSVVEIDKILLSNFENYVFLGDYLAVCSYSEGTIEALIRSENPIFTTLLERNLFGYFLENTGKNEEQNQELMVINQGGSVKISISPVSSNSILSFFPKASLRSSAHSLKISGLQLNQHDDALDKLQIISNSLFFQIDLLSGILLSLTRHERRPNLYRKKVIQKKNLEFPRLEFDPAPISLYWYARSASRMPLLQFLAYYQVIEYYFPAYSREESKRKIRSILKDPSFRVDRETDIGRILSVFSSLGKGYANERSQFKATLNACLEPEELFIFLTEASSRKDFFSTKKSGLTERIILPKGSQKHDEILNSVAEALYDIRCKIVHTKGENNEGETEILLPFSKEVELLPEYIELIKFVSQKVLISASAPLFL